MPEGWDASEGTVELKTDDFDPRCDAIPGR